MVAEVVTAKLTGGAALEKHLKLITKHLGKGAMVKVGFFEGETYSKDEYHFSKNRLKQMSPEAREFARFLEGKPKFSGPVAQVAFWNEFGTKRSPPRPFMRFTVASKSPRWGNALGAALRATQYNARDALGQVGRLAAGQMREVILNWREPPNSKLTRELKGFIAPLRDTGKMAQSVDYEVTDPSDTD